MSTLDPANIKQAVQKSLERHERLLDESDNSVWEQERDSHRQAMYLSEHEHTVYCRNYLDNPDNYTVSVETTTSEPIQEQYVISYKGSTNRLFTVACEPLA